MWCTNCGSELSAGAKFCTKCGKPVAAKAPANETLLLGEEESAAPRPMPVQGAAAGARPSVPLPSAPGGNGTQPVAPAQLKKKKKKSDAFIIVAALPVIIIAGCVFVWIWMNRPVNKIQHAFSSGDIDAAEEIFDAINDHAKEEAVREKALAYAEQIKKDYLAEVDGMDYATANKLLKKLQNGILDNDKTVESLIEEVDAINISRVAFEAAEKFKDDGKYEDAIREYNNVLEEDGAYYQLARSAIEETAKFYRQDVIDSAKALTENGDYESAISALNDALSLLEDDASLLSELQVVKEYVEENVVNQTLASINSAANAGDYKEAFSILNAALASAPNELKFKMAKNDLEGKYKNACMKTLSKLYENRQIEEALSLLNEMRGILPDDTQIPALIETYEAFVPVMLNDLMEYEDNSTKNYASFSGQMSLKDTYEQIHDNAYRLTLDSWNGARGEKVYLNNGKYSHIRGTLAYELCANTKGQAVFEIYADDKLLYSSSVMSDTTQAVDFEVTLGENCHKLKIVWKHADRNQYKTNLILCNVQLFN